MTAAGRCRAVVTQTGQDRRRPFRRPGMLALPGSPRRGWHGRPPCTPALDADVNRLDAAVGVQNISGLATGTPTSQNRSDLRHLAAGVTKVFFDFDGTLTASSGGVATAYQKHTELRQRAPMLAPHLDFLRKRGVKVGIVSRSTEGTIRSCLQEAGLEEAFDGPIVDRSFRHWEGKAGVIRALVGAEELHQVLLVDDDTQELESAWADGIQTYPAPASGGLQKEDFDAMFHSLGLEAI